MSTPLAIDSMTVIQTPLVGDPTTGRVFNDIADIFSDNGTGVYNIDADYPLERITIVYGGVIDGVSFDFKRVGSDDDTVTQYHGTTTNKGNITDPTLARVEINLGEGDRIIAINGYHGASHWGIRVTQITFTVHNSTTGNSNVFGPYGGGGGTPFNFTAKEAFIAVAGTAINCNLSVGQLIEKNFVGGLYGLAFCDLIRSRVTG